VCVFKRVWFYYSVRVLRQNEVEIKFRNTKSWRGLGSSLSRLGHSFPFALTFTWPLFPIPLCPLATVLTPPRNSVRRRANSNSKTNQQRPWLLETTVSQSRVSISIQTLKELHLYVYGPITMLCSRISTCTITSMELRLAGIDTSV
jgi:hypothetical protein